MTIKSQYIPIFLGLSLFTVLVFIYLGWRKKQKPESSFSFKTTVSAPKINVVSNRKSPSYDICMSICTGGGASDADCSVYCAPFGSSDPDQIKATA